MLFHCRFSDRATLLVDQPNKDAAADVATKAADGVAPSSVRPWPPGTFVADVYLDVDEGEEGEVDDLVVDPLPHIAEMLFDWEDGAPEEGATLCGDTNVDDNDNVVTCAKAPHAKSEDHESKDGLVWQ